MAAAGLAAVAFLVTLTLLSRGELAQPGDAGQTSTGTAVIAGTEPGETPDAPVGVFPVLGVDGAGADLDPALGRQVHDITVLIDEINALNQRFRREEETVLLHSARDRELVFRPSAFYRRARSTGADASVTPAAIRAY